MQVALISYMDISTPTIPGAEHCINGETIFRCCRVPFFISRRVMNAGRAVSENHSEIAMALVRHIKGGTGFTVAIARGPIHPGEPCPEGSAVRTQATRWLRC